MKKYMAALLIVGAFILYSFLYHSNAVATLPAGSNSLGASTGSPSNDGGSSTPGAAGTPRSYKDGTYDGSVDDAVWGNVQVQVVIQNGRMTSVRFLQYPHDRNRSVAINNYADPQLCNEAIQAQSANVDAITGATDTSEAFIQSLSDALAQAQP
jgi:uncharacterized protein with FMN-binding domain